MQLGCVQSLQTRCRHLEEGQSQDHASLTQSRHTITQLEESVSREKGRSSTLEEELNAALAEKAKLKEVISEMESSKMELQNKVAELECKIAELQEEEEVGGAQGVGLVSEEDPVVTGSPFLTPVKRSLRKSGRSPIRSGWSQIRSRRSLDKTLEDCTAQSPVSQSHPQPNSPLVSNLEPKSTHKNINSILMELDSYQVSTPYSQDMHLDTRVDSLDSLEHVTQAPPTRPRPLLGGLVTPRPQNGHNSKSVMLGNGGLTTPGHGVESPGRGTDHSPLLDRSLLGLRQAYDLINTLASINVSLQDKVATLAQDNAVREASKITTS